MPLSDRDLVRLTASLNRLQHQGLEITTTLDILSAVVVIDALQQCLATQEMTATYRQRMRTVATALIDALATEDATIAEVMNKGWDADTRMEPQHPAQGLANGEG